MRPKSSNILTEHAHFDHAQLWRYAINQAETTRYRRASIPSTKECKFPQADPGLTRFASALTKIMTSDTHFGRNTARNHVVLVSA